MTDLPSRIGAFFDFDRTVIDADGGVEFGLELARYYRRKLLQDRPGTLGWFGRVIKYEARIVRLVARGLGAKLLYFARVIRRSTLVGNAFRGLQGLPVDELRFLARDYVDEVLVKRIYPDARRTMEEHKAKGHAVVILTTNMRLLVDHFKRHLPVDDVIGVTLVADRKGRATGAVVGPRYGEEKVTELRTYAHARGISLPRSYAYSDHYSDHWMLAAVGHPTVINPGRRLKRFARKRGWPMQRWHR